MPDRGVTGSWRRLHTDLCGIRFGANARLLPVAAEIGAAIPGMVAAAYYVLGPHSAVPPHTGICPNILRCHLGLICPPDCALRIGSEVRSWREGEILVFDDTVEHEAWNRSAGPRVVFHLDFFHPPDQDPAACSRQLRSLREQWLASRPTQQVWIRAGEPVLDADLAAGIDRAAAAADPAEAETVRRLVRAYGLFFG